MPFMVFHSQTIRKPRLAAGEDTDEKSITVNPLHGDGFTRLAGREIYNPRLQGLGQKCADDPTFFVRRRQLMNT